MIRGNYLFWFPPRLRQLLQAPEHGPLVVPNTVPNEGEKEFLRMIARADVSKVAAGGNFYVGLANQLPTEADLLASITTEPGVVNNYAREAVTRDVSGWPSEVSVNGYSGIRSASFTFSASGGAFDKPFTRAFLCNVASGTAGVLFSYSGALNQALTLQDGDSFGMQYEMYLN